MDPLGVLADVAPVDWLREMRARLATDGIQIGGCQSEGQSWQFVLTLPDALAFRFSLHSTVLLVVRRNRDTFISGRDLWSTWRTAMAIDLDTDFFLIADWEPDADRRLHRLPGPFGQRIAWIPSSPGGIEPLEEVLLRQLPKFDIFDRRDPVRGRQLIGRAGLLDDLTKRVAAGQSIGVFGLRKIGKSSVMRAVTDRLDPMSAVISLLDGEDPIEDEAADEHMTHAVWIDVQGIVDRTLDGLCQRLCGAIELRAGFGNIRTPVWPRSTPPLRRLGQLLEIAAGRHNRLFIVFDEYELIFEGSQGAGVIPGIEMLFGLLRAHAQETGLLSLGFVGRDPAHLQQPLMNGVSNPLTGWVSVTALAPLKKEPAIRLFYRLCRRAGLDAGNSTFEQVWNLTAGHPLLLRQYGSTLLAEWWAHYRPNTPRPPGTTEPLDMAATQAFLERDVVRETCIEILHHLGRKEPQAVALLAAALPGKEPTQAVRKVGGWNGTAAALLRRFGLLRGDEEHPQLPFALLACARSFAAP